MNICYLILYKCLIFTIIFQYTYLRYVGFQIIYISKTVVTKKVVWHYGIKYLIPFKFNSLSYAWYIGPFIAASLIICNYDLFCLWHQHQCYILWQWNAVWSLSTNIICDCYNVFSSVCWSLDCLDPHKNIWGCKKFISTYTSWFSVTFNDP